MVLDTNGYKHNRSNNFGENWQMNFDRSEIETNNP